jgi:hypothetical protein
MNEYPAHSGAHEDASAAEEAAIAEFEGFDAELAAALKDFGRQVRPREFDPAAIVRRSARRRSCQVLATSAAALAVLAGATAFAAQAGGQMGGIGQASATASGAAAVAGADPLILPGSFKTTPVGGTPIGYSVYGASSSLAVNDESNAELQIAQAEFTSAGTEYTAEVSWFGGGPYDETGISQNGTNIDLGQINGHPAYYNPMQRSLAFWSGPQTYASLVAFVGAQSDTQVDSSSLLFDIAKKFDVSPAAVPLPLRITGLDSAVVTYAGLGQTDSGSAAPWFVDIRETIDGRSYEISAEPGVPVTPSATGTFTSSGLVSATKEVNGLGITVSTASGKSGSPSAPTASQVLAHVSSLGTDPSGWSTSVIVK